MKKSLQNNKYLVMGSIISSLLLVFSMIVTPALAVTSTPNTLTIESLNMSESIVESKTIVGIGANVWRLPNTSKPNMGGNTVFAAHRQITLGGFRKTIFTDLPEVKTGDKISVVWDGEKYVYEVYATKTVAPNAVQVTFNTADPIITLITCSYSPFGKKRLVVQAKLVPDESPTIASR